jgi:hypothetical protein
MHRPLVAVVALVLGALCSGTALAAGGKGGGKTGGSQTSTASPSTAASAPAATSGTTGDLSTWLAYVAAQRAVASVVKAVDTTTCAKLTTVSLHDRMQAQILALNVAQQPAAMLGQLCLARGRIETAAIKQEREDADTKAAQAKAAAAKAAADAGLPPPVADDGVDSSDPCTGVPGQHAALPAAAGIGTAITALSGALGIIQSFVPTYTATTSSETIDPVAVQRMLQSSGDSGRFVFPNYQSVDYLAVTRPITRLTALSNYISLLPAPSDAKLVTLQQSTVKAAADLVQSFDVQAVLDARAVNAITADVCSIDVSVAAAASSSIAKKTFFTSNEVFESGLVTVSYDVQKMTGEHVTQGVRSVGCELKDAYKLGKGEPPGVDDSAAVACSTDPKPVKSAAGS